MGHDVERVEVVPFDAADSAIGDIGAEVEKMPPLCVETSVAVGAVPAVMVEAQVGEMRVDESPSTQTLVTVHAVPSMLGAGLVPSSVRHRDPPPTLALDGWGLSLY
jgi:hypothetical protein